MMDEENSNFPVYFSNVVCAFSVSTDIDLKLLARIGLNSSYIAEKNMVKLQFVDPKIHASIWKSGKIVCAGAESEDDAYSNAKYVSKFLKNVGFNVRMKKYRIVNVMASCQLPYAVRLDWLCRVVSSDIDMSELHPGATWRIPEFRANMKVFTTGKATILAPNIDGIYSAVDRLLKVTEVLHQEKDKYNLLFCHD